MTREAIKTLFHPFEIGTLPGFSEGSRVLFLGAETGFERPGDFGADLACIQPFRPLYNALVRQGFATQPFAEGAEFDASLILMGRHRGENENRLLDAASRTSKGGLIVVAGSKEDGIQSLRKRLNNMGISTEHLAKYHAQAFWFRNHSDLEWLRAEFDCAPAIVNGKFETRPGMFSHGEVDAGSQFLARYLPKGFTKLAADFGAGWGYLADALYEASPQITGIDLYEADYNALEAARANLNASAPSLSARYFWHDLAREEVKHHYDLIVMNPPFHEGHAAEPHLGQAFIQRAAQALRPSGELFLVANRGLPYEDVLASLFKTSHEIARNSKFKVLYGKK